MASMKYLGKPCSTLSEAQAAFGEANALLNVGWEKLSMNERINFIKYCRNGELDWSEKRLVPNDEEGAWKLMADGRLSVISGGYGRSGDGAASLWLDKNRNWYVWSLLRKSLGL